MISSSCPGQRWAQHTAQPAVLLLCLLAALCTSALPAAAAIPFQQSTVDWTLVPDKPEAAANLSTSCICALLNGTCTPGCCCDTACPDELLQSFKDAGQCLPEGTPPQQLHYCVPAEPFAKASMRCKWSGLHGAQQQCAGMGWAGQLQEGVLLDSQRLMHDCLHNYGYSMLQCAAPAVLQLLRYCSHHNMGV
jgi:hypothetical protein